MGMVTLHWAITTLLFQRRGQRSDSCSCDGISDGTSLQEVREPCRGHRVLLPPRVGS